MAQETNADHPHGAGFCFFYIDDSGSPNDGHIVHAWIEVAPGEGRDGLRHWLDLRRSLYVQFQVPPSVELHATKLIGGRGTPSTSAQVNASKRSRQRIVQQRCGRSDRTRASGLGRSIGRPPHGELDMR